MKTAPVRQDTPSSDQNANLVVRFEELKKTIREMARCFEKLPEDGIKGAFERALRIASREFEETPLQTTASAFLLGCGISAITKHQLENALSGLMSSAVRGAIHGVSESRQSQQKCKSDLFTLTTQPILKENQNGHIESSESRQVKRS